MEVDQQAAIVEDGDTYMIHNQALSGVGAQISTTNHVFSADSVELIGVQSPNLITRVGANNPISSGQLFDSTNVAAAHSIGLCW